MDSITFVGTLNMFRFGQLSSFYPDSGDVSKGFEQSELFDANLL